MKLKIISDGTSAGTNVVNLETGEPVERVKRITWVCDANDPKLRIGKVELELIGVPVELVGEVRE